MTSEIEYRANFNYWTQNEKWKGFFFVVWLNIKDVPNRAFRNLINEYNMLIYLYFLGTTKINQ